MGKNLNLRANIALGLIFAFLANILGFLPIAQAQEFVLPAPGVMVNLSPKFNPPILKGIKIHPDNPLKFDFILDQGDSVIASEAKQFFIKQESTKLIKYFLASLTIPEKDLWVNLSPYEKDRIIPNSFGLTEMGRDLLAEDYMLKQITASLIYPEGETGKRFWKRVYEESARKYGTTNIPINTFNKVWIVPEKAVVYENAKENVAYVVEAKLKVMLEQDYLALEKNSATPQNDVSTLGSQVVREIVIPELTKEVNEGKNFSQLRQVYNSVILAEWYKKQIKNSILSQVYAGKNKIAGVNINDPQEKQKIYERYLQAFRRGTFNYIKEEKDSLSEKIIPRKYFSGGITNLTRGIRIDKVNDLAMLGSFGHEGKELEVSVGLDLTGNVDRPILKRSKVKKLSSYDFNDRLDASSFLSGDYPYHNQVPVKKGNDLIKAGTELIRNTIDPIGVRESKAREHPIKFKSNISRKFARAATLFTLKLLLENTDSQSSKRFSGLIAEEINKETPLWLEENGLKIGDPEIVNGTKLEISWLKRYKLGHDVNKIDKIFGDFAFLETIRLFILVKHKQLAIPGLYTWLYASIDEIIPKDLLSEDAQKIIFAQDNAMTHASVISYSHLGFNVIAMKVSDIKGTEDIDEDKVQEMMKELLEENAAIPTVPTVMYDEETRQYIILDGNHRLEAFRRLGIKYIVVAVIDSTDIGVDVWDRSIPIQDPEYLRKVIFKEFSVKKEDDATRRTGVFYLNNVKYSFLNNVSPLDFHIRVGEIMKRLKENGEKTENTDVFSQKANKDIELENQLVIKLPALSQYDIFDTIKAGAKLPSKAFRTFYSPNIALPTLLPFKMTFIKGISEENLNSKQEEIETYLNKLEYIRLSELIDISPDKRFHFLVISMPVKKTVGESDPILSKSHIFESKDTAQLSTLKNPGGINLNFNENILEVHNGGNGIKFNIDPAMLAQLQNTAGFVPIIINIQPMVDIRIFLNSP